MAIFIYVALTFAIYLKIKKINISLWFSLIIIYFAKYSLVARAQEISYLLFILEIIFIEKLLETNKKRYSILLIMIGILLANLHSSVYPVYFVIYLPYIAEYILSKFKFNFKRIVIEKKENIKILFIVFGISLFTGLCTTTGFAPYTDMIKAMTGVSTSFIVELENSKFDNNPIFYKILILVFLVLIFGNKKVKITDMLYIVGFGAMTIVALRCYYLFLFLAGISISAIFMDFINENILNISTKIDFSKRIKHKWIGFSIIYVYILLVAANNFSFNLRQYYVDYLKYPVNVTNYILENVDISKMKIYNHFNFGSYLEFRGIKTFIDSRSGMFCEEFNEGVTILEDWKSIASEGKDYKNIFEKYGITHALLMEGELVNEDISKDSNWKLLYEKDDFLFYEKIK